MFKMWQFLGLSGKVEKKKVSLNLKGSGTLVLDRKEGIVTTGFVFVIIIMHKLM